MGVADKVQEAGRILGALGVIGFIGIAWLMIYGNLSGNMGFSTDTTGYNRTEGVIENVSEGFSTFFGFSVTLFRIAAIVLLIFMLFGLLSVVIGIAKTGKEKRGFSGQ